MSCLIYIKLPARVIFLHSPRFRIDSDISSIPCYGFRLKISGDLRTRAGRSLGSCQNRLILRERLKAELAGERRGTFGNMLEVARNLPVVGAAWHRKLVLYEFCSGG